jgi:hypothetical protein
MRRYLIHTDPTLTWTLVFTETSGKWHVERAGPRNRCLNLSITEFERSDHGAQLREKLTAAVKQAELDL